jgi:hypothetical protein
MTTFLILYLFFEYFYKKQKTNFFYDFVQTQFLASTHCGSDRSQVQMFFRVARLASGQVPTHFLLPFFRVLHSTSDPSWKMGCESRMLHSLMHFHWTLLYFVVPTHGSPTSALRILIEQLRFPLHLPEMKSEASRWQPPSGTECEKLLKFWPLHVVALCRPYHASSIWITCPASQLILRSLLPWLACSHETEFLSSSAASTLSHL